LLPYSVSINRQPSWPLQYLDSYNTAGRVIAQGMYTHHDGAGSRSRPGATEPHLQAGRAEGHCIRATNYG